MKGRNNNRNIRQYKNSKKTHPHYHNKMQPHNQASLIPIPFYAIKSHSFQQLRSSKSQLHQQFLIRNKKMKKVKYLKEQIYNNHNIFQSLDNVKHFSKTMTAQNIVWGKNYQLKQKINTLKEENSSLKARIWNVQKENRKMDRQIQTWGLKKVFNHSNKPYIDAATAEKVLHDQDYSITSIKIQIMRLERQYEQKSAILENKIANQKNIKNLKNSLNHECNKKKVLLYTYQLSHPLTDQPDYPTLTKLLASQKQSLYQKQQQLQRLKLQTQLKRQSKLQLSQQLSCLNQQMKHLQQISREKILTIRQEAFKLRTEDQSYVNEEVRKLQNVRLKLVGYECYLQDRVGEFVRGKIQIARAMAKYQRRIDRIARCGELPEQAVKSVYPYQHVNDKPAGLDKIDKTGESQFKLVQ